MVNESADRLNHITQKLVEQIQPEKIVVFGSYATGQAKPESDVDLLVILESDLRRDQRQEAISRALRPRDFPLDVLAYTPAEVNMCVADPHSFLRYILTTGRVLYERQSDRMAQPLAG